MIRNILGTTSTKWLMLLIFMAPSTCAFARECDSVTAKASDIFEAANSAFEEEKYESAARLYTEAASLYDQASGMTDCSCPRAAATARSNSATGRHNVQMCKNALAQRQHLEERQKEREAKMRAEEDTDYEDQEEEEEEEQQLTPEQQFLFGSPQGKTTLRALQPGTTGYAAYQPHTAAANGEQNDQE